MIPFQCAALPLRTAGTLCRSTGDGGAFRCHSHSGGWDEVNSRETFRPLELLIRLDERFNLLNQRGQIGFSKADRRRRDTVTLDVGRYVFMVRKRRG